MKRMKMNLQQFSYTAVQGKRVIYLMRLLSDASTLAAALVPYTTEDSLSISADGDTTATKDGPITTPGTPEIEITKTAILAIESGQASATSIVDNMRNAVINESATSIVDKMRNAVLNGSTVEVWEANLDRPAVTADKYKGVYYQGLMTSFEQTANAEDLVEVSFTFKANGKGADGDVTVTAAQQAIASYVFADTAKTGV